MLLTVFRDVFTTQGEIGFGTYLYYALSLSVISAVWLTRQLQILPVRWSNLAAILCLGCILINPAIEALRGVVIGPLYLAAAMFGGFLTVLSTRLLVSAQTVAILALLLTGSQLYPATQLLPIVLINILAAGLGIFALQKRIDTINKIFNLENRVEALESILPMCSGCKKTRDDDGNWHSVEEYLEEKDEGLVVSHGLCPDCKDKHYGDYLRRREAG